MEFCFTVKQLTERILFPGKPQPILNPGVSFSKGGREGRISMKLTQFLILVLLAQSSYVEARNYEGTRMDADCMDLVWAPDTQDLIEENWKESADADNSETQPRLSYVENGPNNKASLSFNAYKGKEGTMVALRRKLDVLMERQPVFARIKASVFIPANNGFNIGNAKMALGLWGGEPGIEGYCAAAGCMPWEQNGFSVRMTRTTQDTQAPFHHGPRIYSYHLNRLEDNPSYQVDENDEYTRISGAGFPMNVNFPYDTWLKVVMDVRLNSFKDGDAQENGFVDLYMYKNGELIGSVSKQGLIFRKTADWHFFGPRISSIWGGPTHKSTHLPLADTKEYFRDYKLFILKPGLLPSQCKNY